MKNNKKVNYKVFSSSSLQPESYFIISKLHEGMNQVFIDSDKDTKLKKFFKDNNLKRYLWKNNSEIMFFEGVNKSKVYDSNNKVIKYKDDYASEDFE